MSYKEFIKVLREASTDLSPETRTRQGRDVEDFLQPYNDDDLPKFIGVDHGGRKQILLSLRFFPESVHGVTEKEFSRRLSAPFGSPEYLEQMERLMHDVYMGTLEMKGKMDVNGFRGGILKHNQYSSRQDFRRYTPSLMVWEDVVNSGNTSAIPALAVTLIRDYHDKLNAEEVVVGAATDSSTYGFPNVSGLRLLYDPDTFELLYAYQDGVPWGPVGYLAMPQFRFFAEMLEPHVKRIASHVSSVRNDLPYLAEKASPAFQQQIIKGRLPRFPLNVLPSMRGVAYGT